MRPRRASHAVLHALFWLRGGRRWRFRVSFASCRAADAHLVLRVSVAYGVQRVHGSGVEVLLPGRRHCRSGKYVNVPHEASACVAQAGTSDVPVADRSDTSRIARLRFSFVITYLACIMLKL